MGRVGFLGIGTMGSRMSARLLAAGHEVTVWNRTVGKTAPLCEKGATLAATPAEAASGKDILLTNLTDAAALRTVITGPGGVLEADPLPAIFVDFATIAPAESAEIAGILESRGIAFLRAPVSGTANVAEAGKLTIMTSGDRAVHDAADPYLAVLGETRYYMGTGEKSRYIKLIHQMMIAGTMQIWGEGLVMGEKAGLDWKLMLEVLANSAVGSGVVKGKLPTLAARVYAPPAMSLHNIVKDLDLALAAGNEVDVDLPATKRVRELYDRAMDAGFEWKDYSALVLEMEARAGLEPKESGLVTDAAVRDFDQVADAFLELIAAHGSEKAFVNPGTDTYPLQEAWARHKERGLKSPEAGLCTHEFTAVSAAHGYYLVTGRPQTVIVHVDAGTANAAGAIGNAAGAQAGLVLCAGRIPYTCSGETRGSRDNYIMWSQDPFDQAGLVRSYVKWHYELNRPENTASVVARAFQVAAHEPAGPVYLTLPREVLMLPARGVTMPDLRQMTPASPPAPDPDAITEAARLLLAADRPLIVAGRNGKQPASVPELTGLAEAVGAAIVDAYEYASVPASHPLNLGPALETMLPTADAVLFVESRVPYVPCEAAPAADAKLVHLERDPMHESHVAWDYPADLRITADPVTGLRALRLAALDLRTSAQAARIAERRARIAQQRKKWQELVDSRARARSSTCPIHPPDRTVVTLVGDGAFTFTNPVAALWTAQHAGAPSLTVVLNNGGYLAAQAPVKDMYPGGAVERLDDAVVTRIQPRPDYARVAEACGALGITVTEPAQVEPALRRGLDEVEHGRSALVDVILADI